MDFTFETIYDLRAMTAVAKAIRKVLRKRNSLIMRIFGLIVVAVGVYLSTPLSGREMSFSVRSIISYVALLFIFVTVFFEDMINGLMARGRLPRGDYYADAMFTDEMFTVGSDAKKASWQYHRINHLAETKYYYIFIFSEHHAEAFEKESLAGITDEEFRAFILEKTGKQFHKV